MFQTALPLVALLVALAPAAIAQDAQTLRVTAHDSGNEYWFEVEGDDARNPTITLQPGQTYEVTFVNEGMQPHNLHFGAPIDDATDIITAGQTAQLTITVPEDTSAASQYWCDPHRALGMEGPLSFGAAGGGMDNGTDNGTGGTGGGDVRSDGGEDTPAVGAAGALVALGVAVLALRRRA